MNKEEKLTQFLTALLARKGDTESFDKDDSLLLGGRIDSLNVLEIVSFLEQEYNYDVSELMFDQNNFDSVSSILELIKE